VPNSLGTDISQQAKEVLENAEKSLAEIGSSSSRLLAVTIFLVDMRLIEAFNLVWDEWIPIGHAPSRCCVKSELARTGWLVEISFIAAK